MNKKWMIYGANGYTGRLIVKQARKTGLEPILAGRNRETIEAMAGHNQLRKAEIFHRTS